MAHVTEDRVKETSTTTGTGAFTLAGAALGYRAFSAVCATGDTCWYCIQDSTSGDWEVGLGTYSGVNTLTRTAILESSNAGAVVTFAAGTKDVFITVPGSVLTGVYVGDTPPSNPTNGRLWWNSGAGVLKVYYADADTSQWVDATPTYSSVGAGAGQWERIPGGEAVITSPAALVTFSLPTNYRAFRLTFVQLLAGTSGAVLYYRVSLDNGSTYYSGGTDYFYEGFWGDGSSSGVSNASAAYGVIGGGYNTALHAMGTVLIDPGSASAKLHAVAMTSGRSNSGSMATNTTGTELAASVGRATNIQIGMSSGNIAAGTFVMEGLRV